MRNFTKLLLSATLMVLTNLTGTYAQVDQTFWFVAPETTRDHAKTPGILRITAFDQTAQVRISQPANPDFHPIELTVPKGTQQKVEFHDYGRGIEWPTSGGGWNSNTDIPLPYTGERLDIEKMLITIENGTIDPVEWSNTPNGTRYVVVNQDWPNGIDGNKNPIGIEGPEDIPILNKGLLIESTNGADISVYYEIANKNNPERFNLKGKNALGRKFLVPSQNKYYNNQSGSHGAREKIDIVATEDGTEVTIRFNRNNHDFYGKPEEGDTLTLKLKKGQTFPLRSNKTDEGDHLGGIIIESNKDIAVTISDDSIRYSTRLGHWDLIGDQLIPISVAGTNYIALHPSYGTIHEKKYWADNERASNVSESSVMNSVFIWPTENDTEISINGTSVGTYDLGEFKEVLITNNAIYISANKDVLVYQVSSYKYELGGAVLPALDCTGSNSVSFAKIYEGAFFVQILTKKKNIWDENGDLKLEALVQDGGTLRPFLEFFDIDPDNSSADWQPVTGTGMDNENEEQWYSFVKLFKNDEDIATGDLTSNVPYTIRFKQSGDKDPSIFDDQLFHLSILDANGASMSYGYFSSYNSVAVAAPKAVCVGEDIILSSNGYAVDWYHESDRNTPIETLKTEITVQDQGEYWVIIPGSNCSSSEPVEVKYVIPDFELEKEDKYCPGDPIELGIDASTLPDNASYQWTVEARHTGTGTTTETTLLNEGENPWELPAMQAEANTQYTIRLLVEAELFGVACDYSNEVELTVGPEPYISLSANVEVCAGTELVAEYRDYQNYVWTLSGNQEPISETHILKPEVSGNYTLTVTTVDGCSDSQEITVTVHELPNVELEDQMDCVPQFGQFEVNGFGSGTSFRWYNGNTETWSAPTTGTGSTFTAEAPMELIVVEVTDNNGCVATASASFDWHDEKFFEQEDVVICYSGEYSIDIDEDNEYKSLTWSYSSDGGATWGDLNGTNQFVTDNSILTIKPIDASNTFSGQYRVEGTYAIDGKNCPVEGQFNLLVEDPPTISLDPQGKVDAKMCEGGTLTITIGENKLDDSDMTYQWFMVDPSLGDLIELVDEDEPWIVAEDAGDYQVRVIYGDNMCQAFGDITVETIKAPQMTAEGDMVCPGAGATLQVTGYKDDNGDQPASYEWIKADPGLPLAPNPDILSEKETYILDEVNIENAGWYRITTYDDQGCFASQYLEVGMHPVPVVTLENQPMCERDDFTLPHPEDPKEKIDSYAWEIEDSEGGYRTISEAELSLLDDGTHTLRLTYTTLGCSESAEMMLTIWPAPVFELPEGDICVGENLHITAEDTFEDYHWSMTGKTAQGPELFSYSPKDNGLLELTVTDENGCTATRSTTVTIHELPDVSLPDQEACPGEMERFQVDFDPEIYTIIWDLPNGRMLYNTNTVTPQNGTYSVSVTDPFGCSGSDTATATTFDVPDVNLGDMAYVTCPDRDGFARMEIEATGSDMETWDFGSIYWEDDGEAAPAYNGQISRKVSFDTRLGSVNPSSYTIYVQNKVGCWSFANKLLLTIPPSTFEAGRIVEACEPTDGTVFEEELDAGEYTFYYDSNDELLELPIQGYTWYRQVGEDSELEELASGEEALVATQGGRYIVEVFDGCWYLTDTFNIDLFPSPVIAGIDSTIYQQIVVMAESGTEPYSYTLNDGQAQDDPTFTGLGNGDYTVFVVDDKGCEASTTFRFESSYDIKVPNFFTPNGDGYNDTWLIEGLEKLPESIIYIYDRYGKLLKKYTSNDPAWNGEYLSRPVPSDDYWYVIHLLPVDKLIKGHFTLKR